MLRRKNAIQVQNGRKAGVKFSATLLIIAMLLSMAMMGCNGKKADEGKVGANGLLYQVPEYKAVTDFEESGTEITAQDVLNALDYLCYMETKNLYHRNEEIGDGYDYLSAQFTSITTIPFYRWTDENKMEWKENPFYYAKGGYQVKLNYRYALHEKSNPDYVLYDFIEFDKVLEAVGAGKITPTPEYLQSVDGVDFEIVGGLEAVYEPIEITRELIASITDENVLRAFLTEIGTYIQQCEDRLVYCQENDVAPVPIVASDILNPKVDERQLLYPIPEMKTMLYFEESGEKITAQDVLNALDYLCYVYSKTESYGFEAYGNEGFEETYKYMSCSFTSITTSTPGSYSGETDSEEYKEWRKTNLPFFEKEWYSDNLAIKINFQEAYYRESDSRYIRESIVGFDKVLDALGTGKIRIVEQYLESIGGLEVFRHFLGEEFYESVELTRELILTIEDETVLALLLADIDKKVQSEMTDFELRLKCHEWLNPMWYQFMMQ